MLTVPFELRSRLAYDAELLGGVSRELASAVMDFHRRRFELEGVRGGKSGAGTVVRRRCSRLDELAHARPPSAQHDGGPTRREVEYSARLGPMNDWFHRRRDLKLRHRAQLRWAAAWGWSADQRPDPCRLP